ncbi:MAG: hypothetical protein ACE5H7_17435, partial [Acidiferrobacterales bacterium]
ALTGSAQGQALAARRPGEGPFLLTAGYFAPHFPLVVPEDYHGRYAGRVPPATVALQREPGTDALEDLLTRLYARDAAPSEWQGRRLIEWVEGLRQRARRARSTAADEVLPPLYPTSP